MRHLLADMDSAEITDWIAYERVHGPLGPQRGDVLHGIQTAVIANTVATKGRKARPADFIPEWNQSPQGDPEQMLAVARAITARLGGTDTTIGGPDGDAG